jgi:soluble lytic murein transglycosylase-like protein
LERIEAQLAAVEDQGEPLRRTWAQGLPPRSLAAFLARGAGSGPLPRRRAAITLLRRLASRDAREFLILAALQTGCPDQPQALQRAAELDREGTVLQLVHELEPSKPMARRVHAAFALGTLQVSEATGTLERLAADIREVPFLRRACVAALAQLRPEGLPPLLTRLLEDPDAGVADQAERALAHAYSDLPEVREVLRERNVEPPVLILDVPHATLAELITRTASRFRLDPRLVASVVEVESDFKRWARSSAGAQGLMQLMPQTAAYLGVKNPFDPAENIRGGSKYLRKLLDRFRHLDLALAAYNAGPTAVERHRGIPPYPETRRYIRKVLTAYRRRRNS